MNKGYTVRLDEYSMKLFNRLYPGLLSKFLQRSLDLAISDKTNFDNIFFAQSTSNLVVNIKE